MKKNVILIVVLFTTLVSYAQIGVIGISPFAAVGEYNHTWAQQANGWSTPDFNFPGVSVQGDLILVNDGTPGVNSTYGYLLSEEGCNPSPVGAYSGKICVIRRNTCDFATKALEAQNAGAIGVIIVNRDPNVMEMYGGTNGANVTIPVVMLSSTDGNFLISLMQNTTVNMIIGNTQGLFNYNLGLKSSRTLISERAMTPSVLAQNGNEFNINLGTTVYNYGTLSQSGISLNVQVLNPNNAVVYNQTLNTITIPAADSFVVTPAMLPVFQLTNYLNGRYQLSYSLSSPNTDALTLDNTRTSNFSINPNLFSYASPDPTTGLPMNELHYRPSNGQDHTICNVIDDPNGSRVAVEGVYFSASTSAGVDLSGYDMYASVWSWDDQFTDLNDPNYFGLNTLTFLGDGDYIFPSNLQEQMVYVPLNNPVALNDNQRYLVCLTNYNASNIFLGYSHKLDYSKNGENYAQPLYITSIGNGGPYNGYINMPNSSFGVPALGVKTVNCPTAILQTVTNTSCVSYTSALGNVYTQSGTYEEVILNVIGCDSIIITLNLTINASDYEGTSYSVVTPSCSAPSDGSITVTLNTPTIVSGDYLLISEYYSGSGSNKAIEIYNASNHTWNLGGTTFDPGSGESFSNWRIINSTGAIFTFPANTIIQPYSTLVIKNPSAVGIPSNFSSSVINGSNTSIVVDITNWAVDNVMDLVNPTNGQTVIRDQSVIYPNWGSYLSSEWNVLPLSSATLGSHFNQIPPGYSILWANGTNGPTLSGISPGTYSYSVVHGPSGCVIPGTPIDLDASVFSSFSDTICDGDSYNWNGQLYTWPGTYTQTLISQYGCDSIVYLDLFVHYNDYINIQSNITFGNAPLNVAFSNQTNNLSNYNFTWYFGDGSSENNNAPFLSHVYVQNGYADVAVSATNLTTGCVSSSTFNDLIFVLGGVNCTHQANIDTSGVINTCVGDSLILSCNTDPTFTYQWNRNNVPVAGATSSNFMPVTSGIYTVTIYQNTCPVTSSSVTVNVNPLPSTPVISASGSINSCSGGSVTLTVPNIYQTYNWSNGSINSSTIVTQSGNYAVSVTNASGCAASSLPYTVNASFIQTPSVCIVGMDSLTNYNRIVWEKPLVSGIDSFYVYKETNVSNTYTKIGATDYNDLAVYLDSNSDPAVQAYRYKLAVLDTCGTETPLSDFHKTIHLTINAGVGNSWNLIWSHYEGLNFGSYKIYRGTSPNNMTLLTTIQSNLNSYSDLAPPIGAVYYQIEIVNPTNCDPLKTIDYGNSRSNIVNNGISSLENNDASIVSIYPNPADRMITLLVSDGLVDAGFKLYDSFGREVCSGKCAGYKTNVSLEAFENGTYYLRFQEHPVVYKVIKQ